VFNFGYRNVWLYRNELSPDVWQIYPGTEYRWWYKVQGRRKGGVEYSKVVAHLWEMRNN